MNSLYHPVKIGNLSLSGNLFLAPVAGYSDRAFRFICVECGADFSYTEMVSAEALVRKNAKTENLMARAPNEKAYAVQIFGGEENTMAQAAKIVLEKTSCECIDINCGCPVPKVIKTGAGSFLTKEPEKLYKIVKAVVDSCKNFEGTTPSAVKTENSLFYERKVPVTVKIRSGWDEKTITFLEAAQAALEAGAAAITLHGRTRAQGYEGKADWNKLAELVEFVNGRIPVFGSGDVFTAEDAKRMLETTKCDGVMFARGAMGNPFIFTKTKELLTTGTVTEIPVEKRIREGFKELDLLVADKGEEIACREARKRFCAYSKGIEGGALLRKQIVSASSVEDYKTVFKDFL